MMSDMFLSDANKSLNRVLKYQNQVDSTKKISTISDDPQATMLALRARNKLANIETYRENIDTARSYLTEAESAASGLNQLLQNVYEHVMVATGGSKNQSDIDIIAEAIDSLKREVVSIGNTNVGTGYLFGGYNFSGTTDGINLTQPFSINETDGHLIYNGIDMSKLAWADDYEQNTALMSSYADVISTKATELGNTTSDEYARDTLCKDALTGLNNLVESGKAALHAAKKYGIDDSSPEYQNLYKLICGTGEKGDADYEAGIEDLAAELYNECSKELAQNTDDDTNAFDRTKAKALVDRAAELCYNTSSSEGLSYSVFDAMSELQTVIDDDLDAAGTLTELEDEKDNRAMIQVGNDHSVTYTFTGIDLMGYGSENIYFLLEKSVSLLRNGDQDGLNKMITSLQNAQDKVLGFMTEIGTSENRMDLISDRYDSSIITYKEMQSNAIDADMAEAIVNLTTAQSVYNAALAGGAEIMRTSLIDFLS
jgi:flagellar hook-associated protein 3